MSNRIVPTPLALAISTGGFATASIAKTSLSGSEKRTASFQVRPSGSTQSVPSNLTIIPTSGWGTRPMFVFGAGRPPGIDDPLTVHGGAVAPPSQIRPSFRAVVRFPVWNPAARTVAPSGSRRAPAGYP